MATQISFSGLNQLEGRIFSYYLETEDDDLEIKVSIINLSIQPDKDGQLNCLVNLAPEQKLPEGFVWADDYECFMDVPITMLYDY